MTENEKRAEEFLARTETDIEPAGWRYGRFSHTDTVETCIYRVTITRHGETLDCELAQTRPGITLTAYDVLTHLTRFNPGSWADRKSSLRLGSYAPGERQDFAKILREWRNVQRVFSDVLNDLQSI